MGIKKNKYLKKTTMSNNKRPCRIRTRNERITSPRLYQLGYGVSYVAFDKMHLIERYVVPIRGQPFVLFNLK